MHTDTDTRARGKLLALITMAAVAVAVALSACGSTASNTTGSAGSANAILQQTFNGTRRVDSGVLMFAVTINPQGSSTLSGPINLSLGGPFQSRGTGKAPAVDFTAQLSALGRQGSLGIILTGTAGYVTLGGTAYQLPQSDVQKLDSSVGSSGSGAGLAGLGINPEHWLQNPRVVGTESVGGVSTTHIRAAVNVAALLADLNTFLGRTAGKTSSSSVPSGISPATQKKIASEVKNPTLDIWTGKTDRLLRKLTVSLTAPVSGQISTTLGGMTSAGISLTLQYSQLNRPQTVSAPAHALPYSQFAAKLQSVIGGLAGTGGGASSGASSSSSVDKYSKCIQDAGQDVGKMQKCSALLKSK